MASSHERTVGRDFAATGIARVDLPDGAMASGHAASEPALLVRRGDDMFEVGAKSARYRGPLAKGVLVHDSVRGPRRHACFNIRTGEALRAPALDPLAPIAADDGGIDDRECSAADRQNGKTLAVASVRHDRDNLAAEVALEANDEAALAQLVPE